MIASGEREVNLASLTKKEMEEECGNDNGGYKTPAPPPNPEVSRI